MRGLVDFGRIEEMIDRVQGRIDHAPPAPRQPLAAPLFLEAGAPRSRAPHGAPGRGRGARLMQAAGLAASTGRR